jgi:hypothetical protein
MHRLEFAEGDAVSTPPLSDSSFSFGKYVKILQREILDLDLRSLYVNAKLGDHRMSQSVPLKS